MPRHNVFTEIDAKSYDAIVKYGWLSELLFALLVDPLEAADIAESISSRTDTSIELDVDGRVFDAPIGLADFQSLPSKDALEKLKITVSQWVMLRPGAYYALRSIASWDRRFAVWCACEVASECVGFVDNSYSSPRSAINAAKAWVSGIATSDQAKSASARAFALAERIGNQAAYSDVVTAQAYMGAMSDAAHSAASVFYVSDTDATVVEYAARSCAAQIASKSGYLGDSTRIVNSEVLRLRQTISNACLTFPV